MKTKLTLIALAFLLIGCASRKVNKSEVKEEVKTEQTVKEETTTNTDTNTTILDTSETTEIEIVPIDNTKPIIYGTAKVYNAKIRHSKRKNDITTVSSKKVAQIERKEVKTKVKREVKVKDKVTERESVYYWWIWILVLGALYLAYRKLRRMNVI